MRIIIQRVKEASVHIADVEPQGIETGLLLFLGIGAEDSEEDIEWLVPKIVQMRIFPDQEGKMNLDITQAGGSFLVISQFTLHASTRKGNRPSFIKAARPEVAIPLYDRFIDILAQRSGCPVRSGIFGADMQVHLQNDGPVTIIIDSQQRE